MRTFLMLVTLVAAEAATPRLGPAQVSAPATTPAAARYPETADGLRQFIRDVLAAGTAHDQARMATLVRSMILPGHDAWFRSVFGPERGARLAAEYSSGLSTLEAELTELFGEMVQQGNTEIRVTPLSGRDNPEATGLQNQALGAMVRPVVLYSVRMVKPGESYGMHLWSLVYVDGGFRLAGKMRAGFD